MDRLETLKYSLEHPYEPEKFFLSPAEEISEGIRQYRRDQYESRQPVAGDWVPLYGPFAQGLKDSYYGNTGSALFNLALFISDLYLVKSIGKGILQGGVKALGKGSQPWSGGKSWFNPSTNYSRFYHTSGFAGKNVPIHHAFLHQNQGIGKYAPGFIKNQMFNLKPIKDKVIKGITYSGWEVHRAVHGTSLKLKLTSIERIYYGTPNWIYPAAGSSTLRVAD